MRRLCYFCYIFLFVFFSCSGGVEKYEDTGMYPDIYPDYINVTIPVNIAPLNFKMNHQEAHSVLYIEGKSDNKLKISSSGEFRIPIHKWKKLLKENKGGKIKLTVFARKGDLWERYKSFSVTVSPDSIDPYLVYRLIEPGYELWNKMGIYQRNLETYKESSIYENKMTNYNCVNCHSFCMQNPEKMLFHMRETYPGTILMNGSEIERLNTKNDSTISALVYPSWHPSGRYIAFSVNKTGQTFYVNNRNRIEVFDSESDVVLYDTEKHEIFTTPLLFSKNAFETFPTFSPNGKILYFCSAKALPVPEKFDSVKYNLCSIPFDEITRTFGKQIDTLYNVKKTGKSASFPRVSPRGKYLLFTLCGYGSFPVWHKDSDLALFDLKSQEYINIDSVNSNDVDSYHSWSSNSRWFVFSSRRDDGLYTRPYIASVDRDGKVGKAFMLPQKTPDYYNALMKSYNIPEFVKRKVKVDSYKIAQEAKLSGGNLVTFKMVE